MHWIIENQPLLIAFLGGVFGACGLTWFGLRQKYQMTISQLRQQSEMQQQLSDQKVAQLNHQLESSLDNVHELERLQDQSAIESRSLHGQLMVAREKLEQYSVIKQEREQLLQRMNQLQEQNARLNGEVRELNAKYEAQLKSGQEKIQLLERAEERLKQQFENLAGQLFEEKTAKVDQQNRQSLEGLLNPLKIQLEGFKKQVNDSFSSEAKERHTLVHELKNLQRLNEQMAKEAVNLTQALKGDNKQQGNWGEVVLAQILAESGLREGHEYQTQISLNNEAGKRYQPDVIVNLPDKKQVVIDSKMALVAYERYFHAEADEDREREMSAHLIAIRSHIKELGRKDYQKLVGVHSLDYVLMFIPVEPAFQVAVQADPSLVNDAMENNIIIVSPTTLLVALRTIDNLWRNEYQNQNAQVIADKAAKLYDKLRLFIDDMDGLGQALEKAGQSYHGAMKKLSTGRGNLIRQAESFKSLGVEVKRPISPKLVSDAQDDPEENLSIAQRHPERDKVN
ncbi:DNA recombination protein RmuC [Vibrio aerogenes CECT 7868]|uniref:DNA recombination protein RmuC n=1 Tax=Vibrio aerogenes CECT 7868 TaxID=1216006 RepID=A0A1M5ZFG2_9VIBR|nr:DNA recombination protein RmuC [Vibrio aerogenes]SHI22957.1 DNA recombination protein RmuC [Vibrio aerogenes CECT 7868]